MNAHSDDPRRANVAARAGRWSAAHRFTALGLWLGFVLLAIAAGSLVGTRQLTASQMGVGESGRAQAAIDRAFDTRDQRATEQVLVQSVSATVEDPAFASGIREVVGDLGSTGLVTRIASPLETGHAGLASADRHSALITFDIDGPSSTAGNRIATVLAAVQRAASAHPSLYIGETGDVSLTRAADATSNSGLQRAERLSVPLTLLVLLIAFGAVVAALLPVALALTAIVAATGLLAFASQLFPVAQTASILLALIGLAVGVDYSLFYLKREREERAAGRGADAALLAAAATSGRSVLISGLTVIVAMSGLFLTGLAEFDAIAAATILVVTTAVVASLTALPALLSLLGDRVNRGRLPLVHRLHRPERPRRAWRFVLSLALGRPVITIVLSAGALLVIGSQAVGIRTASPTDSTDLPRTVPAVQTVLRIDQAFPRGAVSASVVVQASDVTTPAVRADIAALSAAALATGELTGPVQQRISADRTVDVVQLDMAGTGTDAASTRALAALRGTVIPSTIGVVAGVSALVTGLAAGNADFNELLSSRIVLVFGFVLALAFALLLVSFRSIVIPVTAIGLNLLSVAAAYGVLVFLFQDGHGQKLLHFTSTGTVVSWLPLFLFVILFGLSMDYHVFILSRIREARDGGMSTASAVARGIRSTAGTITAAAVVMVFVFLAFATLSELSIKEAGVGLATAVLLDATLVRALLLPAIMTLLGDANWYLPRWLGWLPGGNHGAAIIADRPAPNVRSVV